MAKAIRGMPGSGFEPRRPLQINSTSQKAGAVDLEPSVDLKCSGEINSPCAKVLGQRPKTLVTRQLARRPEGRLWSGRRSRPLQRNSASQTGWRCFFGKLTNPYQRLFSPSVRMPSWSWTRALSSIRWKLVGFTVLLLLVLLLLVLLLAVLL